MLTKDLFKIDNNYKILSFSILVCIIFFCIERLLGIDQFYHPDSLYYLTKHEIHASAFIDNPKAILSTGFYYLSRILNYNYLYLIIFNFALFSLTNLMVFNLIFKNNLFILDNLRIYILYTILYFDPYRLHLAGHVLKETVLIFLMISFIYFGNIFLKIIFLSLSVFIKKNIVFYFIIFYLDNLIKKFFAQKIKYIFYTIIFIIFILFLFFYEFDIFNIKNFSIFNFFSATNLNLFESIERWHYRDMTGREYDMVPNYQNISFPLGFFLKIITWPILIFSGFFLFFTKSFLFQSLGLMMIYFNICIYFVTKKSYMSIGLLILLILVALYSTTFTSYFRYSYVAIYCSIVFFFNNLIKCQKK